MGLGVTNQEDRGWRTTVTTASAMRMAYDLLSEYMDSASMYFDIDPSSFFSPFFMFSSDFLLAPSS